MRNVTSVSNMPKNPISRLFLLAIVFCFMFTACQKDSLESIQNTPISTTEQMESDEVLQLTKEQSDLLLAKTADKENNSDETTLIHLTLDNGNELQFFEIEDDVDGVAVVEIQKCTSCSVSALGLMSQSETEGYTAKDIYWAFSEPGTKMPFDMAQQKATLRQSHVAVQGWGRKELAQASQKTSTSRSGIACNNTSFRRSIEGGFLDYETFVRYDMIAKDRFDSYCFTPDNFKVCVGGKRYKYFGFWNNVKRWAGKICAKSVQNSQNDHFVKWCGPGCSADPNCDNKYYCETYYGPVLKFQRKKFGAWVDLRDGNKVASYEILPNETYTYSWYWRSSKQESFRVQIEAAKGNDEFDVMMDADNR